MCCMSHDKAPLAPLALVFERQATCLPWDVARFAQRQGLWREHGVHGRAVALFMGSGAVSRRQSKRSVRGSRAVTRVGSSGVPRRQMRFFFVLLCSRVLFEQQYS